MTIFEKKHFFKTTKQFDFLDITKIVEDFVKESRIENGIVNIQSLHTTLSVLVNENEPLLLSDIKQILEKIVPQDENYNHDNFNLRGVKEIKPNGHAHCKASLLNVSVCLNIVEKKLNLGTWQKIFAVELDRPRERQLSLLIIGE